MEKASKSILSDLTLNRYLGIEGPPTYAEAWQGLDDELLMTIAALADKHAARFGAVAIKIGAQLGETQLAWLSPATSMGGLPRYDDGRSLERVAATVAAYRDRHGVTDLANPFGEPSGGGQWTRRADRRRAQDAADETRRLAAAARDTNERRAGEHPERLHLTPEL